MHDERIDRRDEFPVKRARIIAALAASPVHTTNVNDSPPRVELLLDDGTSLVLDRDLAGHEDILPLTLQALSLAFDALRHNMSMARVQVARDLQWWTDELTGLLRNAKDLGQEPTQAMVAYREKVRTSLSAAYFEAVRLGAHSDAEVQPRTTIHQAATPDDLWAVVPLLGQIIAALRA